MKSTIAIAALVATSLGLGGVLPALAQDTPVRSVTRMDDTGSRGAMHPMMGGMGHGGVLMLACSDKGAEALEIALVRLEHRLQLTDAQKPLFETFRSKALTSETSFADSCKAARPAAAAGQPDLLADLKAGLAIDEARLTALNAVLPDFETFYASLTDQQKASIAPRGPWGMGDGPMFDGRGQDGGMGRWHDGMGRMMRPDAPGRL